VTFPANAAAVVTAAKNLKGAQNMNDIGAQITKAIGHSQDSEGHAQKARDSRQRGIGILHEVTAYLHNDVNRPNPTGNAGKGMRVTDYEIDKVLLEIAALSQRI